MNYLVAMGFYTMIIIIIMKFSLIIIGIIYYLYVFISL